MLPSAVGWGSGFSHFRQHFQEATHSLQWTSGSRGVFPKTHSSFPTGKVLPGASSTTFLVLHLSRMSPKLRKLNIYKFFHRSRWRDLEQPLTPPPSSGVAQSTVMAWVPEKAGDKGSSRLQELRPGVWFQGSLSETGKEESPWNDVLLSV